MKNNLIPNDYPHYNLLAGSETRGWCKNPHDGLSGAVPVSSLSHVIVNQKGWTKRVSWVGYCKLGITAGVVAEFLSV